MWNQISTSENKSTTTLHTWVSFNRSPVDPLFESRSLPARSMRFRTPCTCWSVLWKKDKIGCIVMQVSVFVEGWDGNWKLNIGHGFSYCQKRNIFTSFTPYIRRVNTKWLLDDCSFIWVLPTDLKGGKQKERNQYS